MGNTYHTFSLKFIACTVGCASLLLMMSPLDARNTCAPPQQGPTGASGPIGPAGPTGPTGPTGQGGDVMGTVYGEIYSDDTAPFFDYVSAPNNQILTIFQSVGLQQGAVGAVGIGNPGTITVNTAGVYRVSFHVTYSIPEPPVDFYPIFSITINGSLTSEPNLQTTIVENGGTQSLTVMISGLLRLASGDLIDAAMRTSVNSIVFTDYANLNLVLVH